MVIHFKDWLSSDRTIFLLDKDQNGLNENLDEFNQTQKAQTQKEAQSAAYTCDQIVKRNLLLLRYYRLLHLRVSDKNLGDAFSTLLVAQIMLFRKVFQIVFIVPESGILGYRTSVR